ncbi:MAG: hypothetical protein ACFFHD_05650 [Promethearchaeota archaeon]
MKAKKSIMGPVISVFVLVLIISILAGLTFLFVAQLQTNTLDVSRKSTFTTLNESGWINSSGYQLTNYTEPAFADPTITLAINNSDDGAIASGNYTVSTTGFITNATAANWVDVNFSYTYSSIALDARTAYESINTTETAGATVVNYLSLIFLAVIFGAILTLVLRIVLPYINLGRNMGGF